ncbi:MAG: rRNA maturation RNase YbeY [Nitrospinota bacterium]|nr:rRNA maturation RNase YbeY [Nitrospinota bacterium]
MTVYLRNEHPDIIIDTLDIDKKVQIVMNCLDCLDQEISILFMKDDDIRKLNKEFRNVDKPTDVLSFPQNSEEDPSIPEKIVLGDIAISLDKAKTQAKEHGLVFNEEIILLLIHGILHLLGYDHEISDQEEIKMRNKTRELFNKIFPKTILIDSVNF